MVAVVPAAGSVGSVERALAILQLYREGRRSLAVTEVAAELGVANSTAHRLLRSLCNGGLLQQDPATRRYELSLLLYRLGNLAVTHCDLFKRAFLSNVPVPRKTRVLPITDNLLIARGDTVEASWAVVAPVLENHPPVEIYERGSWGPASADRLVAHATEH